MTPALISALIALAGYFGIWGYRKIAKANKLPDDELVEAAIKTVIESLVADGMAHLDHHHLSMVGATRLQHELTAVGGPQLSLEEARIRVSKALGR